MPFRQTTVAGRPALALRSTLLELVAVPTAGMRITNLRRHGGREWLRPEAGHGGGWDERFPAFDHAGEGELQRAVWAASVFDHAAGTTLRATARTQGLPFEFTREVTLDAGEPVVRMRYHLAHSGGGPAFPWNWAAHALLTAQPGTVVELPGVRQVRVAASHGRPDLDEGDIVSWPGAVGGDAERFAMPDRSGWALRLLADLPPAAGTLRVTDPRRGERLELRMHPAEVPQAGLWINAGGWSPPGGTPCYDLGVEPAIAPEEPPRLEPGTERTWGVDVVLHSPDETD